MKEELVGKNRLLRWNVFQLRNQNFKIVVKKKMNKYCFRLSKIVSFNVQ